MIQAMEFIRAAQKRGLDFFTGVPCSFLTPIINTAISDRATEYVGATSEGEAIAIAAGAWLAGRGTVVMCQNSGLGNMINPLTSLNWPFRIPTLMIVTWRGQPGLADEPQHELMGEITEDLIDTMRFRHNPFPAEADVVGPELDKAVMTMDKTRLPYVFVMAYSNAIKAVSAEQSLRQHVVGQHHDMRSYGPFPRRIDALDRLVDLMPDDAAWIASTGYCARELYTVSDRPQHFYQVGSMGCASAIALGVALNVRRPVVVLDGDGAALMKMGNMATIGAQQPTNFIHVLMDNESHASTGGQATVSPCIDFPRVALACGYRRVIVIDDLGGMEAALTNLRFTDGPQLIYIKVASGTIGGLGRPVISPEDIALRFRTFLTKRRYAVSAALDSKHRC